MTRPEGQAAVTETGEQYAAARRDRKAREWEIDFVLSAADGREVAGDEIDAFTDAFLELVERLGYRVGGTIRAYESEKEVLLRTVDPDSELGRMLRMPERIAVAGDPPPGLVSGPYTGDDLRSLAEDILAEFSGGEGRADPVRVHLRCSDGGDWEALYVNGRKADEDHSLGARAVLERLAGLGLVALTADRVDAEDLGRAAFPDALP